MKCPGWKVPEGIDGRIECVEAGPITTTENRAIPNFMGTPAVSWAQVADHGLIVILVLGLVWIIGSCFCTIIVGWRK